MQYHDLIFPSQTWGWFDFAGQSQDVRSRSWWVHSVVTMIESGRQLGEDAPNE